MKCQIDDLCEQRTGRDIRRALKKTPKGLQATYLNLWKAIPDTDKWIAKATLAWLAGAIRPLQLGEIAEAAIIQKGTRTIEKESLLCRPQDILDICDDFVLYDKNNLQVVLAHSSVKSFFTSDGHFDGCGEFPGMDKKAIHRLLAESCLTYLCFDDFKNGPCDPVNHAAERKRWQLLDYASCHWPTHLRNLDLHDPANRYLRELVQRFFANSSDANGGCFTAWVQNIAPNLDTEKTLRSTPLYFACAFGLTQVVEMNLSGVWKQQMDQRCGSHDAHPLFCAAYRGHADCVKLLLEAGADPLATNSYGETPLDWAIIKHHKDVIGLLEDCCGPLKLPVSEPGMYKLLVEMKRAELNSGKLNMSLKRTK